MNRPVEERLLQCEERLATVERYVRHYVDAKVVYDDAVRKLLQLQEQWREERQALDEGAVRTLESSIRRIVAEFGEPLSVAKDVREGQLEAIRLAKMTKDAKLARDERVVLIAKVVGVILVLAEIYRTIWR